MAIPRLHAEHGGAHTPPRRQLLRRFLSLVSLTCALTAPAVPSSAALQPGHLVVADETGIASVDPVTGEAVPFSSVEVEGRIAFDGDGNLLVGTFYGVDRIDRESGEPTTLAQDGWFEKSSEPGGVVFDGTDVLAAIR